MSSSVPPAKTRTHSSSSSIIFFINKPLSDRSPDNQVYYVIDLTKSMFTTMYSCIYPQPGEIQPDFAADNLFQKNKLCMTLRGHGIWTRDETYATKSPYEIMKEEYENQEKPKKVIALQLIDKMLEEVASQDTDEMRAKYNEYQHLRNKIFVFPITSLHFMFYCIKEEHFRDFNVHNETEVNPVLEYHFEMVNYSLRAAAEIKDFEEQGPLKQLQSGLTLYRGPTIPVPIFPRPPPPSHDPLLANIRMIGIDQEEKIHEFNERRRKWDQLVIDERMPEVVKKQKEEAEREAATLQAMLFKQNTPWNRFKNTVWSFIPPIVMGGKSKRARTQKRLSKSKKSIKRNAQRHRIK